MNLTQEKINRSGFQLPPASAGTWRTYDEENPIPGYFQFDWLSARHPDLYHQFALSTVGLMDKLHTLIDLRGYTVIDIGAGTGRSAIGAAQKANQVFAVDAYESVVHFGNNQLRLTNVSNVIYTNADRSHLPFQENSFDVAINTWAELDYQEAYRVIKPNGFLIQLGAVPQALCGEITALIGPDYPWVPGDYAPAEAFNPDYPDTTGTADNSIWNGIPVRNTIRTYQFTYVADYQDYTELAAIAGRLYGPKASHYFLTRKQSTFSWRLQIMLGQVSKS
jgi:ubiquinone/menaquinone biosynthesis C-methylase UbiE